MRSKKGRVHFLSKAAKPVLEIVEPTGKIRRVPFESAGPGREAGETAWVAAPALPTSEWQFRIAPGSRRYLPADRGFYTTRLPQLWVQDGQIFDYQPAARISPSRVVKVPDFDGRLPTRNLYVYLPRGYKEHTERHYPVLYMHDGQNCFEAFAADSFVGSWHADEVADRLISQGLMQECLIVGVSNGGIDRMAEYLPLYSIYQPLPVEPPAEDAHQTEIVPPKPIFGKANLTLAYYQHEVEPYLARHYRIKAGRVNRATCGSSMGGLFSIYIAWEHPDFARQHAALSPSFWITRNQQGRFETIERLRTGSRRDIRLWLDSGTQTSPGQGDDGMLETIAARDALLANGYREGDDFQYYLAEGALHNEAAWAKRLPLVFQFLFPLEAESQG
jgi:predicted alpha/beta superfamily hydrolase